jgi:prepilin-type N-terminal cleavage/methylation domain-containing protein
MSQEQNKDVRSVLDRPSSRRAFTLIELLVVVAVLSVLMAILLPALGKARTTARWTRCKANLKGIGLGYLAYLADNNGRFCGDPTGISYPAKAPANPTTTFGGWRGLSLQAPRRPVNAYLGLPAEGADERSAARLFHCPEDTLANNPSTDPNVHNIYEDLGNSYEASRLIITPHVLPTEGIAEPWRSINERIKAPGAVTFNTIRQHQGLLWIGDYSWISQWDPVGEYCGGRHGRRHYYCVVFLDGHASFVRITRGLYEYDGYRMQPFLVPGVHSSQIAQKCSCGEY